MLSLLASEHGAREELTILVFVEPSALDVEQAKSGKPGERKCVDGELRERSVRASVGLVVEDMHSAISNL